MFQPAKAGVYTMKPHAKSVGEAFQAIIRFAFDLIGHTKESLNRGNLKMGPWPECENCRLSGQLHVATFSRSCGTPNWTKLCISIDGHALHALVPREVEAAPVFPTSPGRSRSPAAPERSGQFTATGRGSRGSYGSRRMLLFRP